MRYALLLCVVSVLAMAFPRLSPNENSWERKWKVDLCYMVTQVPGKSANYGFPTPAVSFIEVTKDTITTEYQDGKRITSKLQTKHVSDQQILMRTEPREETFNGVNVVSPAINYQFRLSGDGTTAIAIIFLSADKQDESEFPNSNGLLRDGNVLYLLREHK